MEPLWSPVVANSGNRQQIGESRKTQKQAKTVAAGCDWLRKTFHGKEGVDGSSPSEGSAKGPQRRLFFTSDLRVHHRAVGMEPFMEPSGHECRRQSRVFALNARSGDVRSPLATINSRSRFSSSRLSPTSISASLPAPKWRSETWRN